MWLKAICDCCGKLRSCVIGQVSEDEEIAQCFLCGKDAERSLHADYDDSNEGEGDVQANQTAE